LKREDVMASPDTIERQRGIREAGQQLEVLREKWPLAFPVQAQDVRPLALGIAGQIAAAMGWSLPYTLSVLRHWKMSAVYCRAVLAHDQRVALDGAPAEAVDLGAKELAAKQLARIEARNAAKKKATAPAKPKPTLPPTRRHK
jgi:sRNA-binding protein